MEIVDTSGEQQVEQEQSLRDVIDAAVEEHGGLEGSDLAADTPPASQDGGEPADPSASVTQRARDEQTGRFVKGQEGKQEPKLAPKPAAAAAKPGQEPAKPVEAKTAAATVKAPQSWKPAEREAFLKADPVVQQAALRREREVNEVMQKSAEARRIETSLRNVMRPYEAFIRAENSTVFQAIDNMMKTAVALRMSAPQQKASVVAQLCEQFGISPEHLDAAWYAIRTGQAPQGGGQPARAPQPQYRDPRVDAVIAHIAQQEESDYREVVVDRDKWSEGKAFYPDVREDMADIIEMRARRGLETTWDQAYDLACRGNPDVAPLYEQQKAAERAAKQNSNTARARAAASSVRPSPGPRAPAAADPSDLRALITESWQESQRR